MCTIWNETKDEHKTPAQTHYSTTRTTRARNKWGLVKNAEAKKE